jgi:hypothetical protein
MKKFKEFVLENYNAPIVSIEKTKVDLDDPETVNEINKNLSIATSIGFSDLGEAFDKIRKVLSMYSIELGKVEGTFAKKGSINIPISTHKSSGENHRNVTKPFGEFDEHHIFKFKFELVNGKYVVDAEVVKK